MHALRLRILRTGRVLSLRSLLELRLLAHERTDLVLDLHLEVLEGHQTLLELLRVHRTDLLLLHFDISHFLVQLCLKSFHLVQVLERHQLIFLELHTAGSTSAD